MRNIKAILEYDGTNYHGFQTQANPKLPTIQAELESCLMRVLKEPIRVTGAGRTDAGVHAEGQAINFYTKNTIPLERLPLALNCQLPRDIVFKEIEEVPLDFHAQFASQGKYYVYRIYNNRIPSVFKRNYSYFIPYGLDFTKIKEGCSLFVGTHNFRGFSSQKATVKNFTRTISSFELIQEGDIWEFHIQGNGFLYNMIRIIIGTLLQIGRGKRDLASIQRIFVEQDRMLAGQTAPPQGLCLKKVLYP